jgi:hypothetical protein
VAASWFVRRRRHRSPKRNADWVLAAGLRGNLARTSGAGLHAYAAYIHADAAPGTAAVAAVHHCGKHPRP